MANQDFFHEIAMTKHPIGGTDREVEPAPVPECYFEKTDASVRLTPPWEEKAGFEEQTAKFKEELAQLREHYRPFMENYLPKTAGEVKKKDIRHFEFRYLEKGEVFTRRNDPDKDWEEVEIPDFRGPAEENGKWKAYYRCWFGMDGLTDGGAAIPKEERVVLAFQCVDYKARVYINGNYVGGHEGFFAPFSFDITDYLQEENELVVLCENDIPILGTGPVLDGDKIYAATGPGWDDPYTGWHHCPAGAGIFGKVTLEVRPVIYIDDIFVRPDIDGDGAEVRVGIINYTDEVKEGYNLSMEFLPKNYEGAAIGDLQAHIAYVGPGKNEYRYYVKLQDYRLWEPEHPWLYGNLAVLEKNGTAVSSAVGTFGMKKFISDETEVPKGKFYLNNKPIVLRGANEMGHLQQCVMTGNFEQLVDDILIAKLCNMNYYRITQRPVQEEIYDYFDMLGMMQQCDLPLFSFLRRPQFAEAVRQVGEMEHLVRKHVSTCMVTFINEPMCIRRTEDPNDKYSKRYEAKGHRHLLRDELEAFFAAARKAVYIENPDRVIKNVEGDYDAPTAEGMPDFHCYTMWYTNHGEPIGRLMRGYLPPVKTGWMIGCGEYGAEGLDNEAVMRKYYPKEWLAEDEKGRWYPDKIERAQTHSVQGDWYEEQEKIQDWIRESQIHQARATKLMTDAFRRRGDIMNHTAIHLLIDAWPSGWMKTLLDCDRQPKRAYFAYRDALEPLRINLYTGRSCVYEDETVDVEAWLLNDTSEERQLKIQAAVWEEGEASPYAVYSLDADIKAANARCAGRIPVSFRAKESDGPVKVWVKAAITDPEGKIINSEAVSLEVYKRPQLTAPVFTMGEEAAKLTAYLSGKEAAGLFDQPGKEKAAGLSDQPEKGKAADLSGQPDSHVWMVSGADAEDLEALSKHVKAGGLGVLLLPEEKTAVELDGREVRTKGCGDLFFAAAEDAYKKYPLTMLYNQEKGYIDATACYTIETEIPGEALIYTYDKRGFNGSTGAKPHLPFVKECAYGEGRLILVSLSRQGRVGCNPGLDALLVSLMEENK